MAPGAATGRAFSIAYGNWIGFRLGRGDGLVPTLRITPRAPNAMLERTGRKLLAIVEEPLVRALVRWRLTPNRLTWLGLGLAAGTALLIASGFLRIGGLAFLLVSATDSLDGLLARRTGQVTRFGSCLDSTCDRLSEALVLLGLVAYLQQCPQPCGMVFLHDLRWSLPLVYVVMAASLTVSYVKARAEGAGLECKTGWMQRSERIVALGLGMAFGAADVVLVPLALLLVITIGQRLAHIARLDRTA